MKDEGLDRASLLTPPGMAAIAVVRLVGPGIGAFLREHFSRSVQPDRSVHGKLVDEDRVIDDPVIVLHEFGADINLHGGEWIVQECLNLAERSGFRIVDGLELIDAPTMLEREVLQALPQARTELAIRALLAQPQLWTSSSILHPSSLTTILEDRSLFWLLNPPKIAIVGIPNVGKSTLANQLFGRQRSITADLPGTTRDWVGDWAEIEGLAVHLLDTPGLRTTPDPIEHQAISRSRMEIESADLTILVLDPTQEKAPQDELRSLHADALVVLNKHDLPGKWGISAPRAIPTVATSGEGMNEVRRAIRTQFVRDDALRPAWWTGRQRSILRRALDNPQALKEL